MEKLREVTYTRCNTEEEPQKDALVKQVREAKDCVLGQGWVLVDTYVEPESVKFNLAEFSVIPLFTKVVQSFITKIFFTHWVKVFSSAKKLKFPVNTGIISRSILRNFTDSGRSKKRYN